MKVKKLNNGNVIISDDSDVVLFSIPPDCILRKVGDDKIKISRGFSDAGLTFPVSSISATVQDAESTSFNGTVGELIGLLSIHFFKPMVAIEENLVEVGL